MSRRPPNAGPAGEMYAAIRSAVDAGWSLDAIDARLIAGLPADADRRAALWLYAWSYRGLGRHEHRTGPHDGDRQRR